MPNGKSTMAKNLGLETKKMFRLGQVIIDSRGSKVSFPLGKLDDIYVGQKFRVYEKQDYGNEIGENKKGFFFVSKISDQTSEGKMVIGSGAAGMSIRELPSRGIDFSFRLRTGNVKLVTKKESSDRIINEDISVPLQAFNVTLQYDLGRYLKIPQLFFTFGGEIGLEQVGLTSNVESGEYVDVYYGAHVSLMKKYYIRRFALYLEPLAQFHYLAVEFTDGRKGIENSAISFAPKVGLELALRENLNLGLASSFSLADIRTDDTGNIYPEVLLGVYLGYSISRYW